MYTYKNTYTNKSPCTYSKNLRLTTFHFFIEIYITFLGSKSTYTDVYEMSTIDNRKYYIIIIVVLYA